MAEAQRPVLLEEDEGRHCEIRANLRYMPKDQTSELQQIRISDPQPHPFLPVPINLNGFHSKSSLV